VKNKKLFCQPPFDPFTEGLLCKKGGKEGELRKYLKLEEIANREGGGLN
jgi:hypothetical protein